MSSEDSGKKKGLCRTLACERIWVYLPETERDPIVFDFQFSRVPLDLENRQKGRDKTEAGKLLRRLLHEFSQGKTD